MSNFIIIRGCSTMNIAVPIRLAAPPYFFEEKASITSPPVASTIPANTYPRWLLIPPP